MKSFFFIILAVMVSFVHAHEKKRVFILHSYSQEYKWTKLQNEAFVSNLKKLSHNPLDISVEYLDTKRLPFSEDYRRFFCSISERKISGIPA